ncbi:unnamed protein product, partial [marine sediment metagenome]
FNSRFDKFKYCNSDKNLIDSGISLNSQRLRSNARI